MVSLIICQCLHHAHVSTFSLITKINNNSHYFPRTAFVVYLGMEHNVHVPSGPFWYCHISVPLIFGFFLCSTSLVVSMTFTRFYSIIRPHKAASVNTVKRAEITIACIVVFSIVCNFPHVFTTTNVNWECIPFGNAMGRPYGKFYYWFSLVIQFVIPFVFLLIMNSFIIHKIRTRINLTKAQPGIINEPKSSVKSSELQMFAILLLVTFAFPILTTPGFSLFLFGMLFDFLKTPKHFSGYYLFYHVAQKLHFTNYGINFFLYVISGNKFRTDLKYLFRTSERTKGNVVSMETITGTM